MAKKSNIIIKLKNIQKSFKIGENTQKVLKGVDLDIKRGELLSIMGQSGSGKSTLMNIIGLLDKYDEGDYAFDGKHIGSYSNDELAAIRNKSVGFVFQSFFLLPKLTAVQNVGLPLIYGAVPQVEIEKRAIAMLEKVGMGDKLHHKPNELSGGQQQRVAIARALVGEPDIVLADEPTGALDPRIGKDILDLFIKLNKEQGTTLIIITHDPKVAASCKRQVNMEEGLLV